MSDKIDVTVVRLKLGEDIITGSPKKGLDFSVALENTVRQVIQNLKDLKGTPLEIGEALGLPPDQTEWLYSKRKSAPQLIKRRLKAALEKEGLEKKFKVSQTKYMPKQGQKPLQAIVILNR